MVANAPTTLTRVRRTGWAAALLAAGIVVVSARGDQFPAGGDFNGMAIS